MPDITKATKNVEDLNKLLVAATGMIPVVGGLISTVVAIFADRGEQVPPTFQEAIAQFDAEVQKLKDNDAAWRAAHPQGGDQ